MIKDAPAFYNILTKGNFAFFPLNVDSIEAEKRFLRQNKKNFKMGNSYNFSILCSSSVIGAIGIIPEAGRRYNAEVGYFLDSRFHGRGITLKAVRLVEKYVLENLSFIQRLQAYMVVENVASRRVAEKAGFVKEGCLKDYLKIGQTFHDAYIYGKIIR